MRKELRIGVVGHGFMGKVHGHAYRSLDFYYDPAPVKPILAGVATQTEASWKRAVDTWGYAFGTTDFRALCARDDIDVIDCCAPNYAHKDVLLAALEHGKHVYMDKPLCLDLAEARAMAAAAAAHPECITQMTFNYRFIPAILRAKELIEADAIGRVFSARVCYLHAGYTDPNRPVSWRLDVAKSGKGGALFDLGSHVIDLTRHLLGEFAEVHHLAKTFFTERPLKDDPATKVPVGVDDISILSFRLANGGIGTLESSRLATGVQDEIRFEVHGSNGALRFNLMQPNYLEFYDATLPEGVYGGDRGFKSIECVARYPKPAKLPGPKNTIGWERFHVHCLYNFLAHVIDGTPAQPDILDGAKTQAVMDAALDSARTGVWTTVPSV
ncbi:MAG TPA: Gfo/Idh/MocA family oxidoreductase [Candidatus Hydrogenedentes bacterium]|nr:Gfo/Idh/MocA family oxidoreductase [Candidatus Hydrogenedentota bacterium]HPG68298.1 Gfo/Idh/MocA family oxidoreductase [Candidatus Hydrogenedentota bacterium]